MKSNMRMRSQMDVFLRALLVGCVWELIAVEKKKNRKRGQVLAAILSYCRCLVNRASVSDASTNRQRVSDQIIHIRCE
jgi:hypothetical protein